jgi:hypothetical protein
VTRELVNLPLDSPVRGPALRPGVPMQAPPLPDCFVPRPEISIAIKSRLRANDEPGSDVLPTSVIQGPAGVGKSVLAAALARDPEVQSRFPDGVLWVTLGQRPELHAKLNCWIVGGMRDYACRPITVGEASAYLRTLLLDKVVLLVVDDVWDLEHLRPFLVGSSRCRTLVTTRQGDIARSTGAPIHRIDVMTQSQSLQLLASRLVHPLEGEDRRHARRLARLAGHLPPALDLVAARLAEGIPWADLCTALKGEVVRLEALSGARSGHEAACVEAALNLSLDALQDSDREAWKAFAWLGVLPEDGTIAAPMAATLWGVEPAQVGELLERLSTRALLLPGSVVCLGGKVWPGYRLHGLVHDLARRLLTADLPRGLGCSLEDAHAALLERYRAQTQDRRWHALPDDGYIYSHLTWHLEQARQEAGIDLLLGDETPEGRNGWYEACERLGPGGLPACYLEDVLRAWRLAEEKALVGPQLAAIGLQVRWALITASLNAPASHIPPALIAALVQQRIWTPAQGLAQVSRLPEPSRVEALGRLLPLLPAPLLRQALAVARGILDDRWRPEALAVVALRVSKSERTELLREALATACDIAQKGRPWYGPRWSKAVCGLAPHLPEALLREVLAEMREIHDDWWRATALAGLAPYVPKVLIGEALGAAREIKDGWQRADALAGLVPRLPERLKSEVLEEALTGTRNATKSSGWRGRFDAAMGDVQRLRLLARLVPHLPEPQRSKMLREEWETVRVMEQRQWQTEAVVLLTPSLPPDLLSEALAVLREIKYPWWCSRPLAGLVSQLPEPLPGEALTATWDVRVEWGRSGVLAELLPRVPESVRSDIVKDALVTAQQIQKARVRSRALAGLVPHLAEPLRNEVLREVLATARAIQDDWQHGMELVELVSHLPKVLPRELLEDALAAVRDTQDARWQAEGLARLAAQLPDEEQDQVLREALTAVQDISEDRRRTEALAVVAQHLPKRLLLEAMAMASGARDGERRSEALAVLAPHLPQRMLGEALSAARKSQDNKLRAEVLVRLAPRFGEALGSELLQEGLAAARQTGNDPERLKALVELTRYLPQSLRSEVLAEALAAARQIGEDQERLRALAAMALPLPRPLWRELLAEALAVAVHSKDKRVRYEGLLELVPHLPESLLSEALAAARAIGPGRWRWRVLAELGARLPEPLRDQVLREALAAVHGAGKANRETRVGTVVRNTWRDRWRAEALVSLVPRLPDSLLEEALARVRDIEHGWWYVGAVAALAPRLAEPLRGEVLEETLAVALRIRDVEWRAEALIVLVPHLSESRREDVLPQALAAVRDVKERWSRARLLARLVPYLPEPLQSEVPQEAFATARDVHDDYLRSRALTTLAVHLSESTESEVLGEALGEVRGIVQDGWRAEALAGWVPHLPEARLGEALAMACDIGHDESRAQVLADLVPRLAALPTSASYPLWCEMLHVLADRPRASLLADLRSLAPLMLSLGGSEAAAGAFQAIQDVGRWWP